MSEEQEGVSEMKIDDLDDDDDDGDDVVEWWVEAVIMWPLCWHHWHCLAWHNCHWSHSILAEEAGEYYKMQR